MGLFGFSAQDDQEAYGGAKLCAIKLEVAQDNAAEPPSRKTGGLGGKQMLKGI